MNDASTIGEQLKRIRRERGITQEGLAARAGLSKDLIAKLEQGRRVTCRITSLMQLAEALDVDLAELTGKRERLGTDRDGGSILAIRNAVLSASLLPGLPGLDADDDGQPTPLPELRAAVSRAWAQYWRGEFGPLVAAVPSLITEARITYEALGPQAAGPLAETYQLASSVMEHVGKLDLAAIAAERGVVVAASGDDQLLWAMIQRSYGWALLNQGRARESERLAVRVAQMIEPSFSGPPLNVAVWGNVLITALWAAVATGNDTTDYISMISASSERAGRVATYQTTFGRSRAAMHIMHAYAVLGETGRALEMARRVRPDELGRISYGRHLIDLAQVHFDARQYHAAERRLEEARQLAPVWFRHQLTAQTLVAALRERQTRPSPTIRSLARELGI